MTTSRGARDQTERRANEYVANSDLRSSFEYSAFAGETKEGKGNAREGQYHHSGWLLKRYSSVGPEVQWKRRWFYLLDDRL